MKKINFDIELRGNARICGGYLLTLKDKTEKQVAAEMERLGREFLKNNPTVENVAYDAWEADTEIVENCASVFVSLRRNGRKINIITY